MGDPFDVEPDRGPVRRDSNLARVLLARPDAVRVMHEEFQRPCWDCEVAFFETIEESARYTGLDPDLLVARLEACPLGPAPEPPEALAGPAAGP